MVYDIQWTKKAERQFSKLDDITKKRIIKRLDSITENPFLHVAKMSGIDAFKLRVGNYRIILDIEKNTLVILILLVGHRRSIYKTSKTG